MGESPEVRSHAASGRPQSTDGFSRGRQDEMLLPERIRPLRALARPIWVHGSQQALKFVRISDVDRLTLAEHLDVLCLRGVCLS
ncbi:MAG: hypothetical protein K0R38_7150 [Polyangiaceae bacterium]|nr:hypothetical protein [Polyangiaceae bacterium]